MLYAGHETLRVKNFAVNKFKNPATLLSYLSYEGHEKPTVHHVGSLVVGKVNTVVDQINLTGTDDEVRNCLDC